VPKVPVGIRQDSQGRWRYEFQRTAPDGTTFRKQGTAPSLELCIERQAEAIKAFESGRTEKTPSFSEWVEYFRTTILPVAPSRTGKRFGLRTVEGYNSIINKWLLPHLGQIHLDKLTPEHVEAMLAKTNASIQGKLNIRNLGSLIFGHAQKRGKIPHNHLNPFKAVQIARDRRKTDSEGNILQTARVLTQAEEESLLQAAEGHWSYGCILLSLRTGLRIGEVLGLEWKYIDLNRRTLTVTITRQRVSKATKKLMGNEAKGGLLRVPPKTSSGERTIPLPNSAFQWLKEEKERNQTPFVFPNSTHTNPPEPRRLAMAFNSMVRKAKLPSVDSRGFPLPIPTFHDLRHTWCTRHATEYKTLPNVLMKLAGHSRIETTLSLYVHTDTEDLVAAQANLP